MKNNLIIQEKYFNLEIDPRFPLIIPNHGWQSFTNFKLVKYNNIFIYLIRCKKRIYVGSDKGRGRISDHKCSLKKGKHRNSIMQKSFDKYGIENFYYYPLIEIPVEYVKYRDQIENSYIKLFNTYIKRNPRNGFNIVEFAGNPMLGKSHTLISKRKMSESHIGHKHSLKTKEKMSESHRGVNNHFFGKKHDQKTKLKISQVHKNKKLSPSHTERLSQANAKNYTLLNPGGEIVIINNLSKFCRDNKLNYSSISNVIHKRSKNHFGWRLPD